MNQLVNIFLKRKKVCSEKIFLIVLVFLLSGLSLYAWDFENPEYNIQITISDDWSRREEMEKEIPSCLLSLNNSKTSESFNLIVDDSMEEGKDFERFSEKRQQTFMEETLIKTTRVLETGLGVTMNKNYLKKIDGRYYGIFEYKLEGSYIIQAVGVYNKTQYIYTMTAVVDKPNGKFFKILKTVKYDQ